VDRTWLTIHSIERASCKPGAGGVEKGDERGVVQPWVFDGAGVYICSLMIDGLPVQSTKMVFRRQDKDKLTR